MAAAGTIDQEGYSQASKDLFSGAVGGIAQVLIGECLHFLMLAGHRGGNWYFDSRLCRQLISHLCTALVYRAKTCWNFIRTTWRRHHFLERTKSTRRTQAKTL